MQTDPSSLASAHAWLTQPTSVFSAWLRANGFKHNYQTVLSAMWGKFCAWMAQHHLRLDTLRAQHVLYFLDSAGLDKRIRQRYLRLIERVLHSVHALPDFPTPAANPASLAAQLDLAEARNGPTRFLDDAELVAIVELLTTSTLDERTGADHWKVTRDLALLALFAGAGLKVHEVALLTANCISVDGWVNVPALRLSPKEKLSPAGEQPQSFPHRVRLEPYALPAVRAWLALRAHRLPHSPALFPATPKGEAMHPSTIFRRVRALLAAHLGQANAARLCPQTLRNTFIAQHLRRATPVDVLAQMVGIREPLTLERLRCAFDYQRLLKQER